MPIRHLIKLCQLYKVSADYILGLSPDKYVSLEQFSTDIEKIQIELANELMIVQEIFKKIKNNK